jgi:hypothetical protein
VRLRADFESPTVAVGHPPKPLPDVRRADARSAQIGGPDGIVQCFQVSSYSGEPCTSKRARNLLSKDDWRAALRDEAVEVGPEVPFVGGPELLPGCAEGLAWAGAGPDWSVVGPACESKSKGPPADACEEVDLGETGEFIGLDLRDAPTPDFAVGDKAATDKFREPRADLGVDVVVEVHFAPGNFAFASASRAADSEEK